jgi:DNA gyrase subunit A
MPEEHVPKFNNVEKREISAELQESYLSYAMSVIVQRALPDVRDGLKPVQRRILWAMWESGLTAAAKTRKSANVVGDTMGRYHPHGDSAIYDTMVRMAQDFSLRYPLIKGQGNFGSVDGDSPAAMRYTEAKLAKIAGELIDDIEKDTVDWQPNYDARLKEPKVLPAKLPNLLLNGNMGIAVGMATSIPPHNLTEIADALLHLADNKDASIKDLMQYVKGPDFPTGGSIYDTKAIETAYATGRGAVVMRGTVEVVEKGKSFQLVITELPYQVNKAELIKKFAELYTEKRVEGIRDVREESDREGMRVVIDLKNDASPQKVLNQLYKYSELQRSFHFNMIALTAGGLQPQLMSLKDILEAYLEHRREVVRRRTEFDLAKARERAHILEGLATALASIDKVIATIKKSASREDAHAKLIAQFKLSDIQATAILEMRLQTLAALEREKIENELKEKKALIKDLELILKTPARITKIIKDEIEGLKKVYGDERRTRVFPKALTAMSDEDLVTEEEVVVTLSAGGYIKRLPPDTFRSQKRGGKGLIGSDVAEEDFVSHVVRANTHDYMLFFTDRGRVFQTRAYDIPAASRTAKGRAIHNFLEIPADEHVSAIVNYPAATKKTDVPQGFLVMVTAHGVIKKTALKDFSAIRRSGIIALGLKKEDKLIGVKLSSGKDEILLTTAQGQSIRFKESDVRAMGRAAAGVGGMRLAKGDAVTGFDLIRKEESTGKKQPMLLVVMSHGFAKQTSLAEYKVQNRGGSGIRTASITPKTGTLVASAVLHDEAEIIALSAKGQVIRTDLESVRTTGRAAQGVRLMTLKSGDRIAGIVLI